MQVHFGRCFKVLRVLDLEGWEIESLPSIVGTLIHLRYLRLMHYGLKMLPPSIGNLMIWKMKNLRYLYIEGQEDDAPLQIDTL